MKKLQTQIPSRAGSKAWQFSWFELGSVFFLFLTLEIAVRSIEQAQWITPQPSLSIVLILAIFAGWILNKSPLPDRITLPIAIFLGALVTVWQAAILLPRFESISRLNLLIYTLQAWWQTISMAKPSEGTIHFATFLILFTWIIGYISVWYIIRRYNAWVAVSLGSITVLINLSNLPKEYYLFFFFYLSAAVLLVGQVSITRQYSWFKERDINYTKPGLMYFTAPLLCLSLVAASIASLTPQIRVNRLETLVGTKMPLRNNIEKYLANTLAAIPEKQPSLRSREQKEVLLGDFGQTNDLVHFVLTSERPRYLRSWVYDVYTSRGWTNSEIVEDVPIPSDTPTEELSKRVEEKYTVLNKMRTDVLLTAGDFTSSDISSVTQVQLETGDTVGITTHHALKSDEKYTVTASISLATPEELTEAGVNYPQEITDYYLQLPPNFPERIRQLSRIITRRAKTPYDKAIAIKNYLSQIPYALTVEPPPQGVDGVDYFLSTQRRGNCGHFASAMVVMLRSLGIPSRFYVGYPPGEFDKTTGTYTSRASDYHAWPAVYFPRYGWIEFDPTPIPSNEFQTITDATENYENNEGYHDAWSGPVVDENIITEDTATSSGKWILLWSLFLLWSLTLAAVLLAFVFRASTSRWLKRFARPDYTTLIYGRMCFLASLLKLGPEPQQTPLEYGTRLVAVFPEQSEALDNIVQAYLENRFSQRKDVGLLKKGLLQKSWRQLYPALLKRLIHL